MKLGVIFQLFFVLIKQTPHHHTNYGLKYIFFSPWVGQDLDVVPSTERMELQWNNIVHPLGLQFSFSTARKHSVELKNRFFFFFPLT